MTLKTIAKTLALKLLPNRVLQSVKKVHYARVLRCMTENEEADLRVVKFLVSPGQCAVDVGANIGVYTKYLSEYVGASGRVISIEPIPPTFDILCSNVRELGLENVEPKNCAVSDTSGEVRMRVPRYHSGGENFYEAYVDRGKGNDSQRCFSTQTVSLDALFPTTAVHFIKCDVEGHELNCIRGAAKIIERWQPAWLLEISGDMDAENSQSHQLLKILQGSGYNAYWFDGRKLHLQRPRKGSVNYFFLTPEHVHAARQRGLDVETWRAV